MQGYGLSLKRRQTLALSLAVASAWLGLGAASAEAAAAPRPNLLVIVTDDQRADRTLTVMPSVRNLIGRRGILFTDAHVTTPSCCPSRASLFTARYAHNHRVRHNFAAERLDHRTTVQRALRRRGYRTAIFGKFLNRWPLGRRPPHFDDWAISNGGFEVADWNVDGRVLRSNRYTTDFVSDRAARFVHDSERRDRRPWLAWVTPFAPHWPSTPAARHRDAALPRFGTTPAMRERDYSDKPPFIDIARNQPEVLETSRDDGRRTLMAVDEMVGRLVRLLRRKQELRDTLIVFTSDNGVLLGEHGGLVGKDLPYPAATRVPLLLRWPARVRAGQVRRDPVTNVDLAATLLAAGGATRATDGRPLLTRPRHRALFSESFGALDNSRRVVLPAWRSIRTAAYRYAEYYDDGEVSFREYYDLRADPWELENSAVSLSRSRVRSFSRRLAEYARCRGRACP